MAKSFLGIHKWKIVCSIVGREKNTYTKEVVHITYKELSVRNLKKMVSLQLTKNIINYETSSFRNDYEELFYSIPSRRNVE